MHGQAMADSFPASLIWLAILLVVGHVSEYSNAQVLMCSYAGCGHESFRGENPPTENPLTLILDDNLSQKIPLDDVMFYVVVSGSQIKCITAIPRAWNIHADGLLNNRSLIIVYPPLVCQASFDISDVSPTRTSSNDKIGGSAGCLLICGTGGTPDSAKYLFCGIRRSVPFRSVPQISRHRSAGSPSYLGDKDSVLPRVLLTDWYMYNPSVCEIGDYAVLAMEQMVLKIMPDPFDGLMPLHIQPRNPKQVWVSFFWKPVYHQSCTILKSYAGFIHCELTDIYVTTIFEFVLFQHILKILVRFIS